MTTFGTLSGRSSGQVCTSVNHANRPFRDGWDRLGQVFMTTSPTRTHKGFTENASQSVPIRPICPGVVDEQLWSDPEAYYHGPVDHDATDLKALASFWREAIDHGRQHMRTRWPAYKGKVPDALARDIVEGCKR